MKLRFPVRMLIIDRSPAEASALVAALRHASYIVNPHRAKNSQTVRKIAEKTKLDLVLIGHDLKDAPVAEVISILKLADIDAPVIVLDEYNHDAGGLEARDEALRAGVVDIVPRNEPLMLEHTVRRELSALENRRRVSQYEQHQFAEEQTLQWLVGHARERLAITRGGDIHTANEGFLDLFGLETLEVPWRNGLLECISSDERDDLKALMKIDSKDDFRPVQVELQGRHQKHGEFDLLLNIAPISFNGESGYRIIASPLSGEKVESSSTVIAEAASKRIVSEVRTSDETKTESPARVTPQLTVVASNENENVLGRDQFLQLIKKECHSQKEEGERIGIIYVDLDDYASLKEELGLTRVDALLEMVLEKLIDLAPGKTVIARINDEDFGLLIKASAWEEVEQAYQNIETGICGSVLEVSGQSVLVSAGAGLTGLLEADDDPQVILDRAFNASLSELRPVVGVPEEPELAHEDEEETSFQEIAEDLESAMKDGRLSLVYQPIVSLRGVPVELYEVFMRYRNKQGMMVPPREFLDAAANAGIGSDLDLWLVEQVIAVLGEQHAQGRRTRLLVKVSDQALGNVKIPLTVARGLKKHVIPAERLIIEVSERSAANQVKATRTMMHALRGLNCATAIEHFGVTRKPFRLLEHIPVDYLTIDTSIVNQAASDSSALERIQSIGSRARNLSKFSCAEYVEDAASVGILYDAGIDFVQGFYIQPPLPALDFEFSMMVG